MKATVDRIANRAGASRATFYLHFPSKGEALVATWREHELPEFERLVREFDQRGRFDRKSVRAWLATMLDHIHSTAQVSSAAVEAMALEPHLAASWVDGMKRTTEDTPNLQRAFGGGKPALDQLLLLYLQLERAAYFWVRGDLGLDRDELLDGLAAMWTPPRR